MQLAHPRLVEPATGEANPPREGVEILDIDHSILLLRRRSGLRGPSHSTRQHWAALGSTGQHRATLGSTGQHRAALGNTGQHWGTWDAVMSALMLVADLLLQNTR